MDKYTVLCTELRGSAQSLKGNTEELQKKADKLQKAINKVTRGDYKASDLSSAYTAQNALSVSITRLGEICGAMDTAAIKFTEASLELCGRANLTAYYMQHTDTLSYEELMGTYSAAIVSSGSAVAGYKLVKDALEDQGYSVGSLDSAYNTIYDVPDSGYAELCYLAYGAAKSKGNPEAALAKLIRESDYIPDNSPLKYISDEQVSYYESPSGISCFTIGDGDDAIVIFVGTDGDAGDIVADFTLAFGHTSIQTLEARDLMKQVTEHYQNVVVTGHSLGGHLATDVTLNNKDVDRCVAFEVPERYDHLYQKAVSKEQVSKIKTYNARGSIISSVVGGRIGGTVGNEEKVNVELNGKMVIDVNHGIEELRNSLAKQNANGKGGGFR